MSPEERAAQKKLCEELRLKGNMTQRIFGVRSFLQLGRWIRALYSNANSLKNKIDELENIVAASAVMARKLIAL